MCGRYTLATSPEVLQQTFQLDETPTIAPRYNIAPTQPIPIITAERPQSLTWVLWGLVPPWSKEASIASQLINARAETIDEKPSFKRAFQRRRCLVIADGFYEWQKEAKSKLPQYIHFLDHRPFAMAGLWEEWNSPHGDTLYSATIITTTPNPLIAPLHHRMAVILPPEKIPVWLSETTPAPVLKDLLVPYPPDEMRAYAVSPQVNHVTLDHPDLIQPYQAPKQNTLF